LFVIKNIKKYKKYKKVKKIKIKKQLRTLWPSHTSPINTRLQKEKGERNF